MRLKDEIGVRSPHNPTARTRSYVPVCSSSKWLYFNIKHTYMSPIVRFHSLFGRLWALWCLYWTVSAESRYSFVFLTETKSSFIPRRHHGPYSFMGGGWGGWIIYLDSTRILWVRCRNRNRSNTTIQGLFFCVFSLILSFLSYNSKNQWVFWLRRQHCGFVGHRVAANRTSWLHQVSRGHPNGTWLPGRDRW